MRNTQQQEAARARAEAYAPRPVDSRLMYGFVAAAFTLVMVMVVGGFYSLNIGAHLGLIALIVTVSFAGGLFLRWRQMRRHKIAHATEYGIALVGDPPDPPVR